MSDDTVLRLERRFAAAPEVVFEAWTDPARIVKWWGPEGMTVPESAFDIRVGGHWATTMQNDNGDQYHVSGAYTAIDPPRRLAFTWAWRQPDGTRGHETEVEVTFEPDSGGTLLKLVHKTFQDREARDSHGGGWTSTLNDLERLLAQQ